MKNVSLFIIMIMFAFFGANTAKSQATLEFNRVLLISSAEQTVPANRVWKVEAIYGEQVNACVPIDCAIPGFYSIGIISGIYVNGTLIPSTIRGLTNSSPRYNTSSCSTGYFCCQDFSCANKAADPNILPMWLPAGTTIKTVGNTAFASVIEFVVM